MVNYREILRLTSLNYSQRQIASSVHSSRTTITEVQQLAHQVDISWPLEEEITNEHLYSMFYPNRASARGTRKEPDFNYIHKELAKPGVNLTLLWTEYCENAYVNEETPYMYTHFCKQYRRWAKLTKATMRIQHKPGDVMQVDWAGATIPLHDAISGLVYPIYLFVAVLPCSCRAFVAPCKDMKSEAWLLSHVQAYTYFGGVTRLLIPDNLKTGVIKNTKYDTVLNRSYQELAEHYGTAIVPTRVRRPQDKALVEGSVKYISTWIIAALRNQKFFSFEEIQEAVSIKLDELNNYPFKKREGSRNSAYTNEEFSFMNPLPNTPFEPAVWSTATVLNDYLITDGRNKYSVPFDLIGEKVDIRLTRNVIEAFFNGSRVASHPRLEVAKQEPIVQPLHMPESHRKYLSYNDDEFRLWAKNIGSNTSVIIEYFLTKNSEPEQGYKSCASLTKLADRYGYKQLENACERIQIYTLEPNIRNISTILKNSQDKLNTEKPTKTATKTQSGGITRGAAYYKGGTHND